MLLDWKKGRILQLLEAGKLLPVAKCKKCDEPLYILMVNGEVLFEPKCWSCMTWRTKPIHVVTTEELDQYVNDLALQKKWQELEQEKTQEIKNL
jgi:hypothetical protein